MYNTPALYYYTKTSYSLLYLMRKYENAGLIWPVVLYSEVFPLPAKALRSAQTACPHLPGTHITTYLVTEQRRAAEDIGESQLPFRQGGNGTTTRVGRPQLAS